RLADYRVLGREVAHQDVLAHGRSGARAGHIRTSPLTVRERLSVPSQDGLVAEHVALDAARRGVVIDGQRAHDRRGLLLAMADVRVLTDEVLVLDLAPRHAGVDHVVVGLELGAVRAVALLQSPGGSVDA